MPQETFRVWYIQTTHHFIDVNSEDKEEARALADTLIDLSDFELTEAGNRNTGYEPTTCEVIVPFNPEAPSLKDIEG